MQTQTPTTKSRITSAYAVLWILLAPGTAALAQDSPSVAGQHAFLKQYCVTCHSNKLHAAGLSLESVNLNNVTQSGEALEKVVRKLVSGAMPPAAAPKPKKEAAEAFLVSLETSLDQAAAAHPNPGRPMMMHRLNRTEYLNSVLDIFHAGLSPRDAALLPPDDTSFGFDNNGDVLGLSPLLLERYLSVADRVTTAALGPTSGIEPDVYTQHVDFTVPQREWIEGLPFGTRGGTAFTYRFPTDGEYTIRVKLQRVTTAILGLDNEAERPQHLEIGLDGARVGLFAITLESTVKEPLSETADELLARSDEPAKKMTALEQEQRRASADAGLEVRLFAKAGERRISVAFLTRFEPLSAQVQQPLVSGQGGPPRLLGVDSVMVSGPFNPKGTGDITTRKRILTCQPSGPADESACARKILKPLAHRAYRRPLTGGDMDRLLTAYGEGRKEGTFEAGIAAATRRMLMDPAFLFRTEHDPAQVAPNTPFRISDLELASRLSFFLWSSGPDETLLTVAEHGQLRDPAVLLSQVRRMLTDPRAHNMVTNFGYQWLQLAAAEGVHPDPVIFTDFDANLRQSFVKETELLLQSVLLSDHSVLDLLNAKYTFVNERLARHYGIPGVYGDQFRRVEVNDGVRGGLLGQGSILTATSYPTRTSPVLRGKWILETLLGSPPPPPPPDVPALPEAGEGGKVLSVRERLSEHRKNPACASCHVRMDPLGFALENFDATGRWRTVEANGPADLTPQKVDSDAELTDGTKFEGVAGLRRILNERSDQFVYTMTEKLLTFALGRGADWYDAPAIREAVRAAQKADYPFSTLVASIVSSPPFQMRMSQAPKVAKETKAVEDAPRRSAQKPLKPKGNS
jgi:mono/diheme cytochrome c family protein